MSAKRRVAVVGGGISGLAAGYFIKEKAAAAGIELELRLFEKESRLGGTILTEERDGFVIEGGPDCFLSEKPWARELARRLGIGERIEGTREANKGTFILSGDRLHPLPEGVYLMVPTLMWPLLFSSLLSWPGKLRMGLDLVIPPRRDGKEETLAEFVTRRLGREALEKIAEPLVAGVHAGIPETMSLRASFPRFQKLEDEHGSLIRGMLAAMARRKKAPARNSSLTMFLTVREGLAGLVDEIARTFAPGEIVAGDPVTGLTGRGEYQITLASGKTVSADVVVLAAPSYISAELISEMDKELAALLQAIPYVSTATISLAFREQDLPPLSGFGFVVPRTENRRIMAATWTSRKFLHRSPEGFALLRCFIGGANHPELIALDDSAMTKLALEELHDIVHLHAEPLLARAFRWPRSMPQTVVGHEARMARVNERLKLLPGLYLTGGAYHGLGIPDCIHQGELAAEQTAGFLKMQPRPLFGRGFISLAKFDRSCYGNTES